MKPDGCNGRGCLEIFEKKAEEIDRCSDNGCYKLNVYNWLNHISIPLEQYKLVEIRFKNTRKGYFNNINQLSLSEGDLVAVEASPGHDIGMVSLTGPLAQMQIKKNNLIFDENDLKKVYRKAKPADIEKWKESILLEHDTMIKARKMAEDLNLEMKIGDVEYQGDSTKAIFYYIADERVDFRELIKVLADKFKVRIEMKQIGARQEAGRIGGIGSCGRELCCSTWISNFISVTTNSARIQQVSLNPQKLAGQCSKLKCCLNYEVDAYLDALEMFPDTSIPLKTKEGIAIHQKTDVFKKLMWYGIEKDNTFHVTCLDVETVKKIIEKNNQGELVEKLEGIQLGEEATFLSYQSALDEDSLSRFDDELSDKISEKKADNKNKHRKNHRFNPNKGNKKHSRR